MKVGRGRGREEANEPFCRVEITLPSLHESQVQNHSSHSLPRFLMSQPWLPDGYSQLLRLYDFGPSGLKDYGSTTLHCKI